VTGYPIQKGQTLPLRVERLAFGGKGVARVEGYAVFVEGGLPGQEVLATVVKRKRAYAEARIEREITPSPRQVPPRCEHFGVCGGCALQHLDYEAQLEAKREQVRDALVRLGGFSPEAPAVEPALPSPDRFEYRNKMEFSFSPTRWLERHEMDADAPPPDRFGLGLHVRRRFDRVVNVERCHLIGETASEIVRRVRDTTHASDLPPYSTRTHTGFWRFLVIREGTHTGRRMVHLITHETPPGSSRARAVEAVAAALEDPALGITSLLHGVTTRKGSVAFCEEVRVLRGDPVITEELLGETFEIGPNTFFQTNTRGAEGLFGRALDRGGFTAQDTVWDLYCGVGALSLPLARRARRVVGMELVVESVAAARRNAERNGIVNVDFLVGDIRALLADPTLRRTLPPDAVVLDPPREGIHAEVAAALVDLAPERLVYVSCNPSTLARDLAILAGGGYRPGSVLPVDMFPHTAHIECVTALRRNP
jgi:23S rRNA (uracil1939-C5)-methyltransferase